MESENLEHLENMFINETEDTKAKPVRVTVTMIARRNLSPSVVAEASEDMVQKMLKLTHVRLDRENIGEIDHLEVLGPVTNLYLQQNLIHKIENLESLMDLKFLVLSGNQIRKVENLLSLDKLMVLDLSENLIDELNPEEFPKSLVFLNLSSNPCCEQPEYRLKIIKTLPFLKELDGTMVTSDERREAGHEVTSESEEESDDEDSEERLNPESYHKTLDDVLHLSAKIIQQSQNRVLLYKSSHRDNMITIDEMRAQSRQAMDSLTLDTTPR